MSRRMGFVQACAVVAVLIGAASVSPGATAQELFWTPLFAPDFFALDPPVYGCCEGGLATGANAWTNGNYPPPKWPPDPVPGLAGPAPLITKDAPAAVLPYWWTHGEIELGGRGFTNASPRDGAVYLGQQSLAKYYEYSTIAPGAFGGGHVAAGSSDGLYQVDLWANNVGYNDHSYLLDASKAGEHSLSVAWDQTPHLYSTSAQTPFLGGGSPGVASPILFLPAGFPTGITSPPGILPFLHAQDIGIERDTASVEYRWTPSDAWDIRADYSHMTRIGSQVAGIVELDGFQPTEVPAPVNDTTQNFGANGEYAGTWLSGQKYTIKVAYNGSRYTDNLSAYDVQNPYFP